jgi:predicted Ser/Thr protein kinase
MPASRDLSEGLAGELAELYRQLEQELARGIGQRLARGMDSDDWSHRRLAAVGEVRTWATALTRRVTSRLPLASQRAIRAAFARGSMAALEDLGRPARRGALPGQGAIDRLAGALVGRLDGTAVPIVRSAVDAYQRVAAQPVANILGGALTRREGAQRAWNHLLDQGFTGFTDTRGRRWSAAGYVEMATRTATAQAAVQGHLDRLESLGLDLVIVSNAPQECERCRPWEGKVLQRAGARGRRSIEAESELTGEPVSVEIAGSVAEAIAAGLMHPNCRHTLGAYLPGLTRAPTNTEDPEGDAARQKLRYLEREQRRWKLREAGALDDRERAKAAAKVKGRQAEIREHMKANPTLTRRRDREQIDLSNRRTAATAGPRDPMRDALDSGVASERQLGGGAMARVDRVQTRSGVDLVRKRAKDSAGRPAVEQQDAEELGSLVARAVGARAPRVLRTARDEVHMAHVEGRVFGELPDTMAAAVEASEEARFMALADILMGNADRNAGNVIVTERGTPWAIDHGAAFDYDPQNLVGPDYAVNVFGDFFVRPTASGEFEYIPGSLRPGEGAAIRTELEALRSDFERMGRLDWLNTALRRLQALEDA